MTNTTPARKKHRFWTMERKQSAAGWAFLAPASILIFIFIALDRNERKYF